MGEVVKQILTRPVQLADQVSKIAGESVQFRQECLEVQSKTKKLADLIRQAARVSNDLYERPTRRIINDTEQALEKALSLVDKCCPRSIWMRLFTIIPSGALRKTLSQLDNSIGDVTWLLRVSAPKTDDDDCDVGYLGLPPIASNEPILCFIWEQIANLSSGSLEDRADAAASLISLARDNDRYGKLIIEEGGVGPLLKLVKEGKQEGQENACRAIGLLGRDPDSVEQIVKAGVGPIFAKILKEGHMKNQAMVAWAVSELAANHAKCQDHFAQNNVIRLLVSHLAFETIQEHSKYDIANRTKHNAQAETLAVLKPQAGPHGAENVATMISDALEVNKMQTAQTQTQTQAQPQAAIVGENSNNNNKSSNSKGAGHHHHVLAGSSIKGRKSEDPATKAHMKAMAARALWNLARGNVSICRSITESRALLCLAVLVEKGSEEVKYNCTRAMMEITAVAEENTDLRKTAFKPTTPAAKAVVDQLMKIVKGDDSHLQVPAIRSIGHLARTFRATETTIVGPLVRLIDEKETDVILEAVIALVKFACSANYLNVVHCKSIIETGGLKHLIQIVYFEEQLVQIPALVLLCYITLHVPDSPTLAQDEVLIVLEWATKQSHLMQDPQVDHLLLEAKTRLELYQSRHK